MNLNRSTPIIYIENKLERLKNATHFLSHVRFCMKIKKYFSNFSVNDL